MKISLRQVVAGWALGLLACMANAQAWPAKPIRMMVGLAPGGSVDAVMRIYGDVVTKNIGQPFVLDNRPGGAGVLAASLLTQAPPDGYTLNVTLSAVHTIVPAMSKLTFDPLDDFEWVMLLYSTPTFLLAPADSPAINIIGLAALAKSKAGGLNYGTPGVGSPAHLMGALLEEKFGVSMTHVPYKGGGPLMVDLVAGRVDLSFTSFANARGPYNEKKVKILGVASPARWPGTPDIQTLTEQGFTGVDVEATFGLMAPKGTPAPIVRRLYDEFTRASANPAIISKLTELGVLIRPAPGAEYVKLLRTDLNRLGALVRARGITSQ